MDSENDSQEVFYCEDVGEYRVYCNICDKLCIERFYKNYLKSQTHTINIRKKRQVNKLFQLFLHK